MHDWAPALVPVFVHAHGLPFSTVLTIHHVADQGSFWGIDFHLTNLLGPILYASRSRVFRPAKFSQGGHSLCQATTTVSEHYGAKS